MKKILTVSLFAVMAVSAAHADIASTNYVGAQISTFKTAHVDPINTTIGTWGDAQKAVGTDVATAVVNLSGKMNGTGDGSVANLIATAKQEAIDAAAGDATTKANTALADAKDYADSLATNYDGAGSAAQALTDAKAYTDALANGAVKANTTAIATLNGDANTAGSVAKALADAKSYADGLAGSYDAAGSAATAESNAKTYTDNKVKTLNGVTGTVAADGNYVVQTTEANGIVTVSRQAFDTTISNEDNAQHSTVTAPTTKAVATYVADQIGTVATQTNSVQEKLDQIYKRTGSEATGYEETGVLPQIQKDLQDQIDAIEDEENGVLAQAQAKIDALDATVAVEANSNKFVTGVVEQNGVLTSVQSSTINAAVVALADVPEACAAGGQKKCALSVQNGDFSWEVIEP